MICVVGLLSFSYDGPHTLAIASAGVFAFLLSLHEYRRSDGKAGVLEPRKIKVRQGTCWLLGSRTWYFSGSWRGCNSIQANITGNCRFLPLGCRC